MSHTVKIQVTFKAAELPQLNKAFVVLGWTVANNTSARQYTGRSETYPMVAVNPDKGASGYDIGMRIKGENVEMFSDFYGGSIERSLGPALAKLKQEYAAAVVEDSYPNASVTRTHDTAGNLLLEIEEW